jgi:hypothetical protein
MEITTAGRSLTKKGIDYLKDLEKAAWLNLNGAVLLENDETRHD